MPKEASAEFSRKLSALSALNESEYNCFMYNTIFVYSLKIKAITHATLFPYEFEHRRPRTLAIFCCLEN